MNNLGIMILLKTLGVVSIDKLPGKFINLDYSRVEANPPHPFTKVEAVAHEAVVNYREWATTKAL
jgi:hypothetical protein